MQTNRDLSDGLACHLDALASTSANLFTPLTHVLTTLIAEVESLRTSHDLLRARVSRMDTQNPTLAPQSLIVDIDATQPPSPVVPLQKPANEKEVVEPLNPHFTSSPTDTGMNQDRLKRKRRSSKRPLSAVVTPQPQHQPSRRQTEYTSPRQNQPTDRIQPRTSDSLTKRESSPSGANEDPKTICKTPLKGRHGQGEQLEHEEMIMLPTTPITDAKAKRRRPSSFSHEPVIEGFSNVEDAAKEVEKIVVRREAENCPEAFRLRQMPLSERTCGQCKDVFRNQAAQEPNPDVSFQRLLRSGCKHKVQLPRPETPEGYWDHEFPDTPTQSPPPS